MVVKCLAPLGPVAPAVPNPAAAAAPNPVAPAAPNPAAPAAPNPDAAEGDANLCQVAVTRTSDACGKCPEHCPVEACTSPNHKYVRSLRARAAAVVLPVAPKCPKSRGTLVDEHIDALDPA